MAAVGGSSRFRLLSRSHLPAFASTISARKRPLEVRCCATNAASGNDFDNAKHKILDQALHHVSSSGWSQVSIANGAKDCGYSSSIHGLFPRGGADLALYFYRKSNKQLIDLLEDKLAVSENADGSGKIPTGKFIRDAVETRIRMTSDYQDSWPEAMGLLAHPSSAGDALQCLGQLVDDIWYTAGDKSHDMNWYSKRANLAFIYKSTELFMLQDKSEDFELTWQFLDRRFEDAGAIGSTLSTVRDMTEGFVNGGYNSMFTVIRNMAGIQPR